jgi:hypothetical protein
LVPVTSTARSLFPSLSPGTDIVAAMTIARIRYARTALLLAVGGLAIGWFAGGGPWASSARVAA